MSMKADGITQTSLDSNGDNKTDVTRVTKDGVTGEIYYLGQDTLFRTEKRNDDGTATVATGTIVNGVPQVTGGGVVPASDLAGGSSKEDVRSICDKIEKNLKNYKVAVIKELSIQQRLTSCEGILNDSCFENGDKSTRLVDQVSEALSEDSESKSGIGCLKKMADIAKKNAKASSIELLRIELALSEARSEAANVLLAKNDPWISCESASVSSVVLEKDRSLKINQKDGANESINKALLQRWGYPGDLDQAVAICEKNDGKSIKLFAKSFKQNVSSTNSEKTEVSMVKSSKEFSTQQVAGINKNLAQTKVTVPTATEASPKALAQIQATQGDAAVQQVMQKQSSGILTMTNAVMSAVNTQAVAGTGSSRSVASTTSSSSSSSSSSSRSKSTIGGLKKTTIGKNEEIVEEYEIGNSKARTAQAAGSRSGQSASASAVRGLASTGASADGSDASVGAVTAIGGDNAELGTTSGGGGGGSGFSGGGSRGSGGKSKGGQAANAAANGNSRSPASTSGESADQVSSDEIVSFIKNTDYQATKAKLKDFKFQNKLKANSITIIDRSGNSVGAAEGKIIFVDKGNRFEKQ